MTTTTSTYRDDFDADQGAYKYASAACKRAGRLAERGQRWSMETSDLRQEFVGWAWSTYVDARAKGLDHPTAMSHGITAARHRVTAGRPLSGGERWPGPCGIRYHDALPDCVTSLASVADRSTTGEHWLTQVTIDQ